jgi:hypothetical protein
MTKPVKNNGTDLGALLKDFSSAVDQLNSIGQKVNSIAQAIPENSTIKLSEIELQNMTDEKIIEEMKPMYVNPKFKDTINIPKIFRFNLRANRHYFTATEPPPPHPGEPVPEKKFIISLYPSTTNILDKTITKDMAYMEIVGKLGTKGFWQMMKETGKYGTFIHTLIAEYAETRVFNFNSIPSRKWQFREENYIDFDTKDWDMNVRKDMASLIKFFIDYDVEPIAIEAIGYYHTGDFIFAGALDLLCKMTIQEKEYNGEIYTSRVKKGLPKETPHSKEITALVDFKSGKSGFRREHEAQLFMYKLIAEQCFGIIPDKLFNVAPKDWETNVPTYTIKDQTDSIEQFLIPNYLNIYQKLHQHKVKDILVINGEFNGNGNLSDICRFVPAENYVLNYVLPTKLQGI